MADVKWIKITTDIFDDEKILLIESLPDAYAIITVWFKLLCLAGKQNNSGVFMIGKIAYTDKMLATIFRMKEATVTMALQTFEQFGMVEIVDGVITIPNWGKHQSLEQLEERRNYQREYQREYRKKQKLLAAAESDKADEVDERKHLHKHLRKQNVNTLEEDKEKDKEEDKEKEFHSINHSLAREENIYIQERVKAKGFEGEDAEAYAEELRQGLKQKYMGGLLGQGVIMISNEQFGDLCERLSLDELDKYFNIVAECEKNGKRYKRKSHYQAILDMALKDRKILQKSGKG